MAINIRCTECKKTFRLGTEVCTCGNNLNKNGVYKVRVKLPTGKWMSKQVDSLTLAKKIESKFRTRVAEDDVLNIHRSPTIDRIWLKYIKWAKDHKGSWRDDRQRWEKHVDPLVASSRMDRITPADIDKILGTMRNARTDKGKPYAPATIKQVLVLIKRVYNWATKRGLYEGINPCTKVDTPRFDNRATHSIPEDELQRLIRTVNTWENERAALVIRFALFTGKRRGDILNLEWSGVDLVNGLVTFQGMNTKNKRTQTLPVNNGALTVLRRCHELRVLRGGYVFTSSTGHYYTTFENTWKRFIKRHGFCFRFHDLRHTYASYLASSGQVDIYTLQELLGHREIAMTQRYAHLINGALRRGTNVADDVFPK